MLASRQQPNVPGMETADLENTSSGCQSSLSAEDRLQCRHSSRQRRKARANADASCCSATCSVSPESCRHAQIHGSFTSTHNPYPPERLPEPPEYMAQAASSAIMYDAARVPSPKDGANGMAQPVLPGAGAAAGAGVPTPTAALQAKSEEGQPGTEEEEEEEEEPKAEPVLVKKPHREILDHERKRRVELKCMELQEMMEEQGYTEEEIRQKVSTFRQMLMDKEGVITREGSHTQPV
ncbi:hypothetical protein NQZ68_036581 [Dissostichus eleginoides]|nr:hypothetical protein NQZ68_036581 [Dissostichus eleginoides]